MTDPKHDGKVPDKIHEPNFEQWIGSLNAALLPMRERYAAARMKAAQDPQSDDEGRRDNKAQSDATVQAKNMLVVVVGALKELPAFNQTTTLDPLRDLLMALDDLERGRSPIMLKTRTKAPKGTDSTGQAMIKFYAVLSVKILMKIGFKSTHARIEVSRIFSKKGEIPGIGDSAINKWCLPRSRTMIEFGPIIDRDLAKLQARPDWPFSPQFALRVIKRMAESPVMAEYRSS